MIKTARSGTTIFVYDPLGNLAQEYGPPTGSGTKYLTMDALGSTRLVTTSAGAVDKSFDYLPFGNEIGSGTAGRDSTFPGSAYPHSPTGQDLEFTGKERDSESGLDFFSARYLSSAQARFMSPDPLGTFIADPTNPQSWNLYSYVVNNPLKYTDPSGTCTGSPDGPAHDDPGEPCVVPGDTSVTARAPRDPADYAWESDNGTFTYFSTGIGISGSSRPTTGTWRLVPGAPNNGTPWYKNPCVQSALAKGAASTAIDAVGLLPEGGAVAGAFSLWHGAAGVSNGIKNLQAVKLGRASSPLPAQGPMLQGMVVRLQVPSLPPASHQLGQVLQRLRRLLGKLFPQRRY